MNNELETNAVRKICRNIFNESLNHAARSFQHFINKKVVFEFENLMISNQGSVKYNGISKDHQLLVYTTEVIGDLRGRSYFILTSEEAERLGSYVNGNYDQTFLEAFLLELDNILSASVITIISNHINAKIYGDVPQLHKINAATLKDYLNNDHVGYQEDMTIILVKSRFIIDGKNGYTPGFIWKLPSGFLRLIERDFGNQIND